VSRSSRQSRLTTRPPIQTHSGCRRAAENARGLGDFIDLLLGFLGAVAGGLGLLLRLAIAALGECRAACDGKGDHAQHGEKQTQRPNNAHVSSVLMDAPRVLPTCATGLDANTARVTAQALDRGLECRSAAESPKVQGAKLGLKGGVFVQHFRHSVLKTLTR